MVCRRQPRDSIKSGGPNGIASGSGSCLFALLLNSETKDEGEELLDYSFPADDQELQAILPMKGVFLASCGIMRAAVGEDVTLFVFWSIDGSRQYKVAIRRVERWVLCVVLPGSATDRIARFFAEEAIGLVALRHGRLSSMQGHFGQLDPIFRALARVGCSISAAAGGSDEDLAVGLLYASLGVVPWSSLAESLEEEVSQRVAAWEAKWWAIAQDPPLAQPEGFALFLSQALVATSLVDRAFEACLRLCLLEGALGGDGAAAPRSGGSPGDEGDHDVRCHSVFLLGEGGGESAPAAGLPSHQYSVIRHGPWLLFMLWRMAPVDAVPRGVSAEALSQGASPRTPAKALLRGDDPFGVDLCLALLESLPLPEGYGRTTPRARARGSSSRGGGCGGGSSSSRRDVWRVFNPLLRSTRPLGRHKLELGGGGRPGAGSRSGQPASCLFALELRDPAAAEPPETAAAFGALRDPLHACRDRLSPEMQLRCPEMASRAAARRCVEWRTSGVRELLSEWSELDWMVQEFGARRAAWLEAPRQALSRHVLLNVLKGERSLDKLWAECLDAYPQAGDPEKRAPRPAATRLGDGEPWRFQVGAPFQLSDLPPLVSAGALTGAGQRRAWAAVSALRHDAGPGGGGHAARAPRHVLLHLDAAR